MKAMAMAVCAAATFGPGCSETGGNAQLQQDIRAGLREQLGVEVLKVSCESAKSSAQVGHCTVRLDGEVELTVTTTADVSGGISWKTDGLLLRLDDAEQHLKDEFSPFAEIASVDCGPPVVVAAPGTTIHCDLLFTDGGRGIAVATVADADGLTTFIYNDMNEFSNDTAGPMEQFLRGAGDRTDGQSEAAAHGLPSGSGAAAPTTDKSTQNAEARSAISSEELEYETFDYPD